MKIGLLTVPFNNNYGGFLQAYALKRALESLGHEVWFIDLSYRPYSGSLFGYYIATIKNIIKKFLLKKDIYSVWPEEENRMKQVAAWQFTQGFVDRYLSPKISPIYSSKDLSFFVDRNHFDAFICGSDQIWRPSYLNHFIKTLYLDFVKGNLVKMHSYAASFGTEDWEYSSQLTAECRRLISRFSSVSAREDSGVRLIFEKFKIEAKHVPDPTLLLNSPDYIPLFESANIPEFSKDKIFSYVLDNNEDKEEIKNILVTKLGYPAVSLTDIKGVKEPVEKWVRGIFDSQFVITDSFHGVVFSVLFNKPFLVVGNKDRGLARFNSLLKEVQLEDRLVLTANDLKIEEMLRTEIDWRSVNSILKDRRNEGFAFLQNI